MIFGEFFPPCWSHPPHARPPPQYSFGVPSVQMRDFLNAHNFPHLKSGIFCRMCCYFAKTRSIPPRFVFIYSMFSSVVSPLPPSIHFQPQEPEDHAPHYWIHHTRLWLTACSNPLQHPTRPQNGRTKGNSIVNYEWRLDGMGPSAKVPPSSSSSSSAGRFCATSKPVFSAASQNAGD